MNNTNKMSKKEYGEFLMNKVKEWIAQGDSGEQAVSKLTTRQYDFLIDNDFNIESLWLTPEQLSAPDHTEKRLRNISPNGYNKKYPLDKQELYKGIVKYLESIGCIIQPITKCNYRDITFINKGTKCKIVLSNPRS